MAKINFYSSNKDFIIEEALNRAFVVKIVEEYLALKNMKILGVTLSFCTDYEILEINKKYLEHNYYTDVITFDYSFDTFLKGEAYISVDTVKSNADKESVSFEKELVRVVFHSILHLVGFKDKTPEDTILMRHEENYLIKKYYEL